MKKPIWILVVIIVIVAIIIGVNSSKNNSDKLVKIAVVMPFSSASGGDLSIFSNNVVGGIELALKQSGISSSSVEIIREDSGGFTTNGALTAFKRAVDQDKADIIFGPFGPAQTLTIAPSLSSTTPVTVISISNCDERFEQYPTIFCIYPGIRDQIEHAVSFMKSKNWKNVYLFTENTELGLIIEQMLKGSEGINLIGSEKITPNIDKDFRTPIAKMISAKPDVVYATLAPNEGFILFRQYPQLSKNIPLYIGTDINQDQLVDIFGDKADNIYFAARLSDTYDESFAMEFESMTGNKPDYFAALSHSAASILFSVLEKSMSTENLPKRMINIGSAKSAVDSFIFKDDRTVSVPMHSYEYKGGQFVEVN